jgi:hypothetical protein
MSLRNSLNFRSDWSDLRPAWELIEEWLDGHKGARVISPIAIATFFRNREALDPQVLIRVPELLGAFVEAGQLVRKYAVEAPSGELLYPYYDSISEIPERVPGVFDSERVLTREADIIPVFTEPSLNAVAQ